MELSQLRPVLAHMAFTVDSDSTPDGRPVLTISRLYAATPAWLWRHLTEPDELARWSPIVPDRPLTTPGPATARENPTDAAVDAEVLACKPEHSLEHRWGSLLVGWELTPVTEGTLLTLRQTITPGADLSAGPGQAGFAAGWHLCLGVLVLLAGGLDVPRAVGADALAVGWEEIRDRYAAALHPQPARHHHLLIRTAPDEVYAALVDPEITSRFWFDRGSGRLEPGARVTWVWDHAGAEIAVEITVERAEPGRRLRYRRDDATGHSVVDWRFVEVPEGTVVVVGQTGPHDTTEDGAVAAADGDLTMVLCAAKAYLEHGIEPGFVRDHLRAGVLLAPAPRERG